METICAHCGSKYAYAGGYCAQSPTGKHILTEQKAENMCRYCGSKYASAGGFCTQSPTKKHVLI